MSKESKSSIGLLFRISFFVVVAVAFGGITSGASILSAIQEATVRVFLWTKQTFNEFLPYWGLEDFAKKRLVFFGVLLVMSICGTCVSSRRKNRIWTSICCAFDIISLVNVAISAFNMK